MRKVMVSNCVSVDGFFGRSTGEADGFIPDEELIDYSREILNAAGLLLMGRKTYEIMASYWPLAIKDDAVITHKMNHLPKIVFSNTIEQVDWNNAQLARRELADEVLKLKNQAGKDILVLGSGSVVNELMGKGLIDEYRLILIPLILGEGNPVFGKQEHPVHLELLKTTTLSSGTILLYYRVDPGSR